MVEVLRALGITVYLSGRRLEEAARRAAELECGVWAPGVKAQLFVNAAPVTDKPLEEALNFLPCLEGILVAFDHEMPGQFLVNHCNERDIVHIPGVEMYYPQMYEQWGLFLEQFVGKAELPALIQQAEESM